MNNPVVQNAEKIRRAAEERGLPPPLIIQEQPELFEHLQWVVSAFTVLSNARGYGYSAPNPIALSEIGAYCALHDLKDLEDIEDLIYYIQVMDSAWLSNVMKQLKSKVKSKGHK